MIYRMNREQYRILRTGDKVTKPMTHMEIVDYINNQLGLQMLPSDRPNHVERQITDVITD